MEENKDRQKEIERENRQRIENIATAFVLCFAAIAVIKIVESIIYLLS